MKIQSILNNSALIAVKNNKEIVLIGRGIGFQKRPGDEVDTSKIEKEFAYSSTKTSQLLELLEEVPERYFEITSAIIRYANRKLKRTLDKSIYITLLDHVNSAIERYDSGIFLDFAMLSEVEILYPQEFEVAKWALDYINMTLDKDIPEDECGFMVIHIINATSDEKDTAKTKQIMKIATDIANITKEYYGDVIDEQSMSYSRYMTHLKYLAIRYLNEKQLEENEFSVFSLRDDVVEKTQTCIQNIDAMMQENYGNALSEYEKKYITLHLCRLINLD